MALQYLILGLLNDMPMSGYDLHKQFEQTAQHFWSADRSQIYRTLYKLQDAQLVTVERIIQEDNPDKKVYHLTDAGRDTLQQWLTTPIETPPIREAWLGQIFFTPPDQLPGLSDVLAAYLQEARAYQDSLHQLRHYLSALGMAATPQGQLRLLTLDYGIGLMGFEVAWLEAAIKQIQGLSDET